jgi:hypothetical protein
LTTNFKNMSTRINEQYHQLLQELMTEARFSVIKQIWAVTFQENNGVKSATTDAIRKDIDQYTADLNQLFNADVDTITPKMISIIEQLIVDAKTRHVAALDKIQELY